MISADTSAIIEYIKGQKGEDLDMIDGALSSGNFIVSSVVICELLSDPKLSKDVVKKIISLPTFKIDEGYWRRVGLMRAKLLEKKLKARLADTLVAQSCIDHNISLVARDKDFRHFKKYCGLKLIEL